MLCHIQLTFRLVLVHKMSIVFYFIVFDFQQQVMFLDNGSSRKIFRSLYIIYTGSLLYVRTVFYNDQFLRCYLIILKPYEYLYACYKSLLKWVSNPFKLQNVTSNVGDTLSIRKKNAAAKRINWLYKIPDRFIFNMILS